MGAQHSNPIKTAMVAHHPGTVTEKPTESTEPMTTDEWVNHLKETMPSFKGHESDYFFAMLGLILLSYFLYCLLRKMRGTTRVTFTFHHKVNDGEEIRVVGNAKKLGQWDPTRAAPMKLMHKQTDDPVWVGYVDLNFPLHQPLEYKYVVMTCATYKDGPRLKEWEPCANRFLREKSAKDGDALTLHQSWGGRNKKAQDKVPDFADIVSCNPLKQPLMGA